MSSVLGDGTAAATVAPQVPEQRVGPVAEPLNQLATVRLIDGEKWFRNGSRWQHLGGGSDHLVGWNAISDQVEQLVSSGVER